MEKTTARQGNTKMPQNTFSFSHDFIGRIRNISLSPSQSHALIPLFEAITNSIQSIEDRFGKDSLSKGKIVIEFLRDANSDNRPIGFIIQDNGTGFSDENFKSFCTADSRYKLVKGGKGVGRFTWLRVFEMATIESVYLDTVKKSIYFEFVLDENDQIRNFLKSESEMDVGTKITLGPYHLEYALHCPRKIETIANKIIGHFISYFINVNTPSITIFNEDGNIDLFSMFTGQISRDQRDEFSIEYNGNSHNFVMNSFLVPKKISDDETGSNAIYYGANGRTVLRREIDSAIGMKTISGNCVFLAYVEGSALDNSVNQERTAFSLPQDLIDQINRESINIAKIFLSDEISEIREEQAKKVTSIRSEHPRFLSIAPNPKEFAQHLALSVQGEEEIYIELSRKSLREYKSKKKSFLDSKIKKLPDFDDKAKEFTASLERESIASLAEYVYKRKLIIDVFESRTEYTDHSTHKYDMEEAVHELICPLRKSSDGLNYNDHNLWIVDDNLAFYTYFSSDQTFKKITGGASASTAEPDLAIFDLGLGFDRTASNSPITIIEFKKPGRNNYRLDDNPFIQVRNYVKKLRDAKIAKSESGKTIRVIDDRTPFSCYIIADDEPTLRDMMIQFGPYHQKAGHGSYYKWDESFNTFIEVISYAEMIKNAKARHEAFFERLGIK